MTVVDPFHRAFGIPIKTSPTIPDIKRVKLRRRLISEEFEEVIAEFDRILARYDTYDQAAEVYADIARLAKELSDLRFTIYGTDLEFGIPTDSVDKENLRSQMSKLGEDGQPIRRHDGKVLKGPDYTPADTLTAIGIIEGTTTP